MHENFKIKLKVIPEEPLKSLENSNYGCNNKFHRMLRCLFDDDFPLRNNKPKKSYLTKGITKKRKIVRKVLKKRTAHTFLKV